MYCHTGYQQSLPLTWLQAPSEQDRMALLEFLRGVLYGLSASTKEHGTEVHASRVRHAFDRLGAPALYRVGLKLLSLLREAEALSGGYWVSAPFRVIEIEGHAVFIGALPSAFGFLGDVTNDGLCRLLTPEVAARFPRQDMEAWMGVPPVPVGSHVTAFFQHHQRQASPTISQAEIEYLSFTGGAAVRSATRRRFLWDSHPVSLAGEPIALCRQKHFGIYRYFSAELRSGRVISEAAIEQSIPRLLFALAHDAGMPVVIDIRHGSESVEVSIAEHLPIEEYRLALLLSRRIVRQSSRRTFHLAPQLAPALIGRLMELGCILETDK